MQRLVRSLEGVAATDVDSEEEEPEAGDVDDWDDWGGAGNRMADAKGKGKGKNGRVDEKLLRSDFKSMVDAGYRPGFYRISDDEIVSLRSLLRDARAHLD